MARLSINQIIVRVAIITLVVELLFMLTLEHSQYLRSINGNFMAVFNAVILIAITTPLTYLFVIKPSVDSRDQELRNKAHLLSETQRIAHIGGWDLEPTGQFTWSGEMYRIFWGVTGHFCAGCGIFYRPDPFR